MGMSKCRVLALAILLAVYLGAALLLSSVALHEPRPGSSSGRVFEGRGGGIGTRLGSGPALGSRGKRIRPQWCSTLHYVDPPMEQPIALVSFPGSGNTWFRYLLQQATGLYTGSVYKDFGLLKNGFPAEAVKNGSVLVVKTHEWGPAAQVPFAKAILLIRNPEKAIQAEFNRQSGGHVGFASADKYRRARGRYWQKFVSEKIISWRQTNLNWLQNFTKPVHVVLYDDLTSNVEDVLRKTLNFMKININEELMKCAIEKKEGIYKRKKKKLNFDPFTPQMRHAFDLVQEKVYEVIRNQQSSVNLPESTAFR